MLAATKEGPMAATVGFIGVGNMGNPMASNVLKASFAMTVFDTNPKAMENLIQAGARRAGSPREVVESSEIVLTSLPASPDVEAVYLEQGGLVDRAKPGTILIDLSSVLPSTPRKIEPRAKARGVHFLEAPVSGGVSGARAATLAIMVGGDAEPLSRATRPLGGAARVRHGKTRVGGQEGRGGAGRGGAPGRGGERGGRQGGRRGRRAARAPPEAAAPPISRASFQK